MSSLWKVLTRLRPDSETTFYFCEFPRDYSDCIVFTLQQCRLSFDSSVNQSLYLAQPPPRSPSLLSGSHTDSLDKGYTIKKREKGSDDGDGGVMGVCVWGGRDSAER